MGEFGPHESIFIYGCFILEICSALLSVPLFLIIGRSKLIIAPFLLLTGFFYTVCYFDISKGTIN